MQFCYYRTVKRDTTDRRLVQITGYKKVTDPLGYGRLLFCAFDVRYQNCYNDGYHHQNNVEYLKITLKSALLSQISLFRDFYM